MKKTNGEEGKGKKKRRERLRGKGEDNIRSY